MILSSLPLLSLSSPDGSTSTHPTTASPLSSLYLVIDVSERRIQATVVDAGERGGGAGMEVICTAAHRFDAQQQRGRREVDAALCSFDRPTCTANDLVIGLSSVLERLGRTLGRVLYDVQALVCVMDHHGLPAIALSDAQQHALCRLDQRSTLAEQLTLDGANSRLSFAAQCRQLALLGSSTGDGIVTTPGTLLMRILTGRVLPIDALEAACTCAYDPQQTSWDATQLDESARRLLGDVVPWQYDTPVPVGEWMRDRFDLHDGCAVLTCLPTSVASYISFCPAPEDAGLGLSSVDEVLVPTVCVQPSYSSTTLPNILRELEPNAGHAAWLTYSTSFHAGRARETVRTLYGRTRRSFRQLVQAVAPGGTVGLDDKLFVFYAAPKQGRLASATTAKARLWRFEHGTQVAEFGDLRANVRCLLEGQAMTIRRAHAKIKRAEGAILHSGTLESTYAGAADWLPFRPFDATVLPRRFWTWGRAAGVACVRDVFGQVLGRPLFVAQLDIDEAALSEEGCSPGDVGGGGEEQSNKLRKNDRQLTRATMGAVYMAAYALRRRPEEHFTAFVRGMSLQIDEQVVDDPQATPRPSNRTRFLWQPLPPTEQQVDDTPSTPTQQPRLRSRASTGVSRTLSEASRQRSASLSTTYGPARLPTCAEEDHHNTASSSLPTYSATEPDEDMWLFYGSLLEEQERLSRMVG